MQLIITDEQPANDMRLSHFLALAVNLVSNAAVSMSPLIPHARSTTPNKDTAPAYHRRAEYGIRCIVSIFFWGVKICYNTSDYGHCDSATLEWSGVEW